MSTQAITVGTNTSSPLTARTPGYGWNNAPDRLFVRIHHLNRVLKEMTGRTTGELIGHRVAQEAKILLKQTDWPVAGVGYALGFDDQAHFSNYVKKQTSLTPVALRA